MQKLKKIPKGMNGFPSHLEGLSFHSDKMFYQSGANPPLAEGLHTQDFTRSAMA
jgi:hypothetical protein